MAYPSIRRILSFAAPLVLAACASQEPPPAMSMEEMMAKATELGTPGDGHARLQPLVGKFSTVMTIYMPGEEPSQSQGSSVNTWVLDGRFLRQDYSADFMGMPFSGVGTTGYDNATGMYEGTWIDNMSTFMMPVSRGEWDEATNTITSYRTYMDPISELETMTRDVVHLGNPDEILFEMYETKAGGEESKLFEIVYTRTE